MTGQSFSSTTNVDLTTIKYDSTGVQQWLNAFDRSNNSVGDVGFVIAVNDSNDVFVAGRSDSTRWDYTTIRYDTEGQRQWVATFNGLSSLDDQVLAIVIDDSSNSYVTGRSRGLDFDDDYVTIKYDSSGNERWMASFNGEDNLDDRASSIVLDTLGNIYVTGTTTTRVEEIGEDFVNFTDIATVKYGPDGVEKWATTYAGSAAVGPNSHGHPHEAAIKLYRKYSTGSDKGNKVYRTDTKGTMKLTLKDGGGWLLNTSK